MITNKRTKIRIFLKKKLLIILGTFLLIIGVIGIILPLLPTTPFLLASAFCYMRGSEKMYSWLTSHKIFGSYIRNYYERRGMSVKSKFITISFLWISIFFSVIFIINNYFVYMLLLLIGSAVTTHIIFIKIIKKGETGEW
jgi:uncharacterized protein